MVRRIIQLSEEQDKALKEQAAMEGVSIAELVRRSVSQTLSRTHITDKMRARAKQAVGFAHDGPTDLSTNHDRYWAEDMDNDHVR